TLDGRDHEQEKELFKLYGKNIQEKRIHGVKYLSRRSPNDFCCMFYDTLPNLNEFFSSNEIAEPLF
ncbi:MAG: hypothetical protein KJ647_04200, partial [Candidatus Omnitrophica bacterium]|nr:hypothetical protein [Candidatus Omnitrophota bacterium]